MTEGGVWNLLAEHHLRFEKQKKRLPKLALSEKFAPEGQKNAFGEQKALDFADQTGKIARNPTRERENSRITGITAADIPRGTAGGTKKMATKKKAAPKKKAPAKKKAAPKKKGAQEILVVGSKVKEVVKANNMRADGALIAAVSAKVHELLVAGVTRAQNNKRKTVTPNDL